MIPSVRTATALFTVVALSVAAAVSAADTPAITQIDWGTRTAACPAKVTQSANLVFRVTDVNDLVIDFKTGERVAYRLRAKGTPVSAVPPQNPFTRQAGAVCPVTAAQAAADIAAVRAINDPSITPPAGRAVSVDATIAAARSHA